VSETPKKPLKDSDFYETPPEFFRCVKDAFGEILLDTCAEASTAKCPRFITQEQDALKTDWYLAAGKPGYAWCNPPYSKEGKKDDFIKKMAQEAERNVWTIALLPVKTDTKVWHQYVEKYPYVFIEGRLSFWLNGKPSAGAGRFANVLVCFCPPEFYNQEKAKLVKVIEYWKHQRTISRIAARISRAAEKLKGKSDYSGW